MKVTYLLFLISSIQLWLLAYSFNGTKWECYNLVFGQIKVSAAFVSEDEFAATIEAASSLDGKNVITCFDYIDGSALGKERCYILYISDNI